MPGEHWETRHMHADTWQRIDEMFTKHPIMRAEGVSYQEINASTAEIGIPLPDDYREFIHRYGGAIVGPFPIFGLRRATPMAKDEGSVIDVTRQFREQGWPGTDAWVVFSLDHAGNPIGLDRHGKVWISDHDARVVELLANDFEDYLCKQCLKS